MANMFKMIKEAASMQKQMKQIQKELERQTIDFASGGVKVVARGDMSIASVTIDPAIVDPSKVVKLEGLITSAVNGALNAAKKQAGSAMSKLTEGTGLGSLLGS